MLMQVIRLAAGPAAKQLGPLGSYRYAFLKLYRQQTLILRPLPPKCPA